MRFEIQYKYTDCIVKKDLINIKDIIKDINDTINIDNIKGNLIYLEKITIKPFTINKKG